MMENNVMTNMLYEAVLCSPGMGELVKIDLKISRKQVLLLGQALESGLKEQSHEISGLLTAMPEGSSKELMDVMKDCLAKAGLTDLNEKLKSFNTGKSQHLSHPLNMGYDGVLSTVKKPVFRSKENPTSVHKNQQKNNNLAQGCTFCHHLIRSFGKTKILSKNEKKPFEFSGWHHGDVCRL